LILFRNIRFSPVPDARRPVAQSFVEGSLLRPLLGLLLTVGSLLPASAQVHSRPAPTRDYHLYVGADFYVSRDDDLVRITNMDGNRAVLSEEDGTQTVLSRTTGFRWTRVPKIGRGLTEIKELKTERVFSPAKDPNNEWAGKQTNIMNYQQDQMTVRLQATAAFDQSVSSARSQAAEMSPQDLDNLEDAVSQVAPGVMNAMNDTLEGFERAGNNEFYQKRIDEAKSAGGYDAITLEFKAATPEPVANAYVVAISRISVNGRISDVTFHQSIGRLDSKPRRVYILQTGLPPGYEVLNTDVYLFTNGKELPTNLSEKRLSITHEEARQYLLLDRVASNRRETLPPEPVWNLAPEALMSAESPEVFDYNLLVDIDSQGQLTGIQSAGVVPEPIRQVVAQMEFLPALDNGDAVPGQLAFNLADYFR